MSPAEWDRMCRRQALRFVRVLVEDTAAWGALDVSHEVRRILRRELERDGETETAEWLL